MRSVTPPPAPWLRWAIYTLAIVVATVVVMAAIVDHVRRDDALAEKARRCQK